MHVINFCRNEQCSHLPGYNLSNANDEKKKDENNEQRIDISYETFAFLYIYSCRMPRKKFFIIKFFGSRDKSKKMSAISQTETSREMLL